MTCHPDKSKKDDSRRNLKCLCTRLARSMAVEQMEIKVYVEFHESSDKCQLFSLVFTHFNVSVIRI